MHTAQTHDFPRMGTAVQCGRLLRIKHKTQNTQDTRHNVRVHGDAHFDGIVTHRLYTVTRNKYACMRLACRVAWAPRRRLVYSATDHADKSSMHVCAVIDCPVPSPRACDPLPPPAYVQCTGYLLFLLFLFLVGGGGDSCIRIDEAEGSAGVHVCHGIHLPRIEIWRTRW